MMKMSEECAANYMDGLIDEINKLHIELAQLKQHLREIEWVDGFDTNWEQYRKECPVCGEWKDCGHSKDCWLAQAIKG